jgi:hypothetical protein
LASPAPRNASTYICCLFQELDHFQVTCTEDAIRLPKFPTRRCPLHAANLRLVHSAGPRPPPRPSSLSDPLPSRACHHCLLHASSPFGRTDASLATCMLLFLLPALHTATLAPWGSFGRARQLAPPSVPATTAAAGRRMPRFPPNCTSSIYDPLQLSRPIRVAIVC